eukprot:COSAG01_NODE_18927_length_1043_cov_1.122881_1_plen_88_part_00
MWFCSDCTCCFHLLFALADCICRLQQAAEDFSSVFELDEDAEVRYWNDLKDKSEGVIGVKVKDKDAPGKVLHMLGWSKYHVSCVCML